MVIQAGYPVVSKPLQLEDPFEDLRTFSFRSLDGLTVLPCTGDEFIFRWGCEGLDVPKRTVEYEEVPEDDGAEATEVKVGVRELFVPLFLGSNSSHRQYLADRARLRSLFNHRTVDWRANGGTFDLVANSALGERSLRCFYLEGMDGNWQQDSAGAYWESIGLKLLAVRPYWWAGTWQTPLIRRPSGARWFGRFPGRLASSRALGQNIGVTVPGDAESWPVVDLTGPSGAATITGRGLQVSVPGGLASGETARIITQPGLRSVLFNGVKNWSRVGPLTTWRPLQPGDQELTIDLAGAVESTSAQVSGGVWCETPW